MGARVFRFVILSVLASSPLVMASPSAADPYKWCAVYGGEDGGGTNCGFKTLEQCSLTIRGMGGMCQQNTFYTGPDNEAAPSRRTPKRKTKRK
jgi:hypothetical protein